MARKKNNPDASADVPADEKITAATAKASKTGTVKEAATDAATAVKDAAGSAQPPAPEEKPNAEAAKKRRTKKSAAVIDIGSTDGATVMLSDAKPLNNNKKTAETEKKKPAAKTPRKRAVKPQGNPEKKETPLKEEIKDEDSVKPSEKQKSVAVSADIQNDAEASAPIQKDDVQAEAETNTAKKEEPAVDQRISKSKARRNRRKKAAQRAREESAVPAQNNEQSADTEDDVSAASSASEEMTVPQSANDDSIAESVPEEPHEAPAEDLQTCEADNDGVIERIDEIAELTDSAEQEEENEQPVKVKRRYTLPIFAGFTAVVALGSMLFIFLLFSMSGSSLIKNVDEVNLPNFTHKTREEIEADDAYSKFDIEFVEVYSSDEEKGVVVSQTPKPPKKVKENAHIVIRVSAGAHTVSIPNVVGLSKDEAVEKLKAENLSALVKTEVNDKKEAGTVIRTEPEAGETVDAEDTITIYVSGEERDLSTVVPNIIGLPRAKAASQLAARGLEMGTVTQVISTAEIGTVISQNPKAGTSGVTKGSSVAVTVSGDPEGGVADDGHIHNYVTTVVAPNSTSIGFTQHTCTICGDVYYDNVKSATG